MSSIKQRILQERRAVQGVGGDDPYVAPAAPNPKVFGVEITPDSPDKNLLQAGIQDTAQFAHGFLPGLAKLGTAVAGVPLIPFGDPLKSVETGKEFGLGLVESGRKLVGVTGIPDIIGFEGEQKRALDFYKAHPGFAVLDASIFASFGAGTVLKSALGNVAKGSILNAIRAGAAEGISEAVIRDAMIVPRSILTRGIRGAIGAETTELAPFLVNGITKAVKTGKVAQIAESTVQALVRRGVSEASALKIAQSTATNIAESVARQAAKLKTLQAVAHPVGAAFRAAKVPVGAAVAKVFGTTAESAVGRVFGNVIKANTRTALEMEKWLEGVLAQKGIVNTVENGVKEIMEWRKQRDFSGMTAQQTFDDFKRYVDADVLRAKSDKLLGVNTVLVKVLPKTRTDAMIENLRGRFDEFASQVENNSPNLTREQKAARVFDLVEEFMTENHGYDFGKYATGMRAVFNKKPVLATLEREINALSSMKPSLSFGKLSPEAAALQKEIEGTGWRQGLPPAGKVPLQVTEVLGGLPKEFFVGITTATKNIPEMKALGEKASALEKAGDFVGANKIHNQILDKGESALKGLFRDMPDVKIDVQRTKGIFGDPEATFQTKITMPEGRVNEVLARLSELADKNFKQDNLHFSEVLTELPKGSKMGVEVEGGYIYEPNIDLRFSMALTDAEYGLVSKTIQDINLAGSTLHADRQGINLYNISKFKNHVQFKNEIERLVGRLRDARDAGRLPAGDGSPVGTVRKLLNIGDAENGATRSYENIRGAFRAESAVSEVASVAADVESKRTFLGRALDALGFSTRGEFKGTQEFLFQQSFTERALSQLGGKYGQILRIKRPTVRTTTEGVKAGVSRIAIPVEHLYDWLDNHRTEFSKGATFRKHVVFDIKEGDLTRFGFEPQLAKEIIKISEQSLRSVPSSVIGIGEKALNYLRTANPGFLKFGKFYDNFLRSALHMRYQSAAAFAFQAQQFMETGIHLAMMLKSGKYFPGAQTLAGLGARLTPGRLGGIFSSTKTLLQKIAEKPTNVERVIMRDNFLTNVSRMDEFMSMPEVVNMQRALETGGAIVKKVETAQDIALSQKQNGFWLNMWKEWYTDKSTNLGKGIASKFGMALEEAGAYTESIVNGKSVKVYKNPQVAQAIKEAAETLLTYKTGFQTSPLIRTLNLIWFPMRFQVKATEMSARWLGSLSPISRMMIISEWSNFANWVGTEEGKSWIETHQNVLYNILAYTTAYEQIGDSLDAVSRGQLFGGNTGLIGGVPFGFVFNIAQELALIGQDPQTLDPKTGLPFRFRRTPRELVSYASFVTALEEFVVTLAPGMPLYTLSGGVFKGLSWGSQLKKLLDQGLGAAGVAAGLLPGEDITQGGVQLEREFERVPLEGSRF